MTSFENKVRWLCAILFDKVHTTEGRNILYKYRHTRDGRRVLFELCQHASRSTAAVLRAGDIFAKLANSQLDSSWNRPYTDYISWFIRQVNLFNELCITPDDRLSDRMARTMLERAVSKARPLQNVRIRELEHMKATGGPGWTLTQYVELLKDASATMDREQFVQAGAHVGRPTLTNLAPLTPTLTPLRTLCKTTRRGSLANKPGRP